MVMSYEKPGYIYFVCKSCGALLYDYVIGDGPNGSRNKYLGAPSPGLALSGFDDMTCPLCEARLSSKPREVRIMALEEFEEAYEVDRFAVRRRVEVRRA